MMVRDNAETQKRSIFRKKCVNVSVRFCLECTDPCSLKQNTDDMVSEDVKRAIKWHWLCTCSPISVLIVLDLRCISDHTLLWISSE